jgi:hypothetical protein
MKNRLDIDLEMQSLVDRKQDNIVLKSLTGLERQIIVGVWLEKRDTEICKMLGLTPGQLNWSLAKLLQKFNRSSRVGLALAFERSRHKHCGNISIWKPKITPVKTLA